MTSVFKDGTEVEVGMFGYECAIGIAACMGVRRGINRVYMQIEGAGYIASVNDVKKEFNRCGDFQRLSLGYVQMQLAQATQSAACNATHDVQQRLARWLLLCSDRASTQELNLSQDFISIMLGVQRTTVTHALGELRRRRRLDYSRAKILLTDVEGLEAEACECYHLLKEHFTNYIADGDPPLN